MDQRTDGDLELRRIVEGVGSLRLNSSNEKSASILRTLLS